MKNLGLYFLLNMENMPFFCVESIGYPADSWSSRRRLTNMRTAEMRTRIKVTKVIQKPGPAEILAPSTAPPTRTRTCKWRAIWIANAIKIITAAKTEMRGAKTLTVCRVESEAAKANAIDPVANGWAANPRVHGAVMVMVSMALPLGFRAIIWAMYP